jgi:hypothetical protein
MNIRQAILRAADHVEANPQLFDFCGATNSPTEVIGRGCYVGWIAFFSGEAGGQRCGSTHTESALCRRLLGIPFRDFEDRMRLIVHDHGRSLSSKDFAATALRLYADKYHPQEGLPDSVRNIFTMSNANLAKALEAS